jgi:dipeptidyl aminopeptidase/acylaminoacyl peptidase
MTTFPRTRFHLGLVFLLAVVSAPAIAEREPYRPTSAELIQAYQRADLIGRQNEARAFKLRLQPNWIANGERFWYRNDLPDDTREFVLVESATGKKSPAFDHARLAERLTEALGRPVEGTKLPFQAIEFLPDGGIRFEVQAQAWRFDPKDGTLTKAEARPRREPPRPGPWRQDLWEARRGPVKSPDGKATARIEGFNVRVKVGDGEEFAITDAGTEKAYFARLQWTPDSKRIVATRVMPGDRGLVHLVESSPRGGGRAVLHSRVYDQPGDKVDTFDFWILDVEAHRARPIEAETIDYGDMPQPRWRKDGKRFTYEKMDRGYGRFRILEVDVETGKTKTLVDDDPETFVDSTSQFVHYVDDGEEILWRSERDGWGHLYRSNRDGKIVNQITKGPWVVRGVVKVDEKAKRIVFTASGMDPKEDPYLVHYYRVNFDGTGLTPLTPGHGNHSVEFSPDDRFLVDTYSLVDEAPVHELRTADGRLVTVLERADISALKASGWRAPEVFVAKGRDGKTDIWGVVYRPTNFDPNKRYPLIEDIYAGPQDSFVPKTFSAAGRGMQALAELGFVVVKIDGMGTRNRSKAFHDVCYKNLADAGFPDRILWMKALAAKYPYADATRVGVFGGSAGGQNAAGAVLFHPEFYKAAVASCGCHDNRMDKIWWNEQWMGTMGPHYEANSNITHAAKLEGHLLLIVGELDSNVPPESTYRFADALIKANKEFELVVLPGVDHTGGGPYGERKRRDFFVRNLLGVEPPDWNGKR